MTDSEYNEALHQFIKYPTYEGYKILSSWALTYPCKNINPASGPPCPVCPMNIESSAARGPRGYSLCLLSPRNEFCLNKKLFEERQGEILLAMVRLSAMLGVDDESSR